MEKLQKVIIIGNADVIKLGIIRALGSAGYDVSVIHLTRKPRNILKRPIDCYSKFSTHYFFVEKSDGRKLIEVLTNKCADNIRKPIIFALDDYTIHVLDSYYDILKEYFLFSHLKNGERLTEIMDKHLMKQIANRVGLRTVNGWPIPYLDGEYVIPNDIEYPCFVKGILSYNVSKGIQKKCGNKEDLVLFLNSIKHTYPHAVYAEKFISVSKEFGVIGLSSGDKCITPAKAELLVMGKGKSNGVSMLGRVSAFPACNDLSKQINSLLTELGYVGIFNIDFIESNGEVFFVEINFRYAAYGYGVFRAGINLPALCVDLFTHKELPCLKTNIKSLYYFNEKIGAKNVINNTITCNAYKKMKQKADVLMVQNNQDIKPNLFFIIKYFILFLKSFLKSKRI